MSWQIVLMYYFSAYFVFYDYQFINCTENPISWTWWKGGRKTYGLNVLLSCLLAPILLSPADNMGFAQL